jgi:hypothetical protein
MFNCQWSDFIIVLSTMGKKLITSSWCVCVCVFMHMLVCPLMWSREWRVEMYREKQKDWLHFVDRSSCKNTYYQFYGIIIYCSNIIFRLEHKTKQYKINWPCQAYFQEMLYIFWIFRYWFRRTCADLLHHTPDYSPVCAL